MHIIDVSSGMLQNAVMDTINYTLRIPRDLKDALKDSAEREGRSLNSHFIYILRRYLIQHDFGLPSDLDKKLEDVAAMHKQSKSDEIIRRLEESFDITEPGSFVMSIDMLKEIVIDCVARGVESALEKQAESQSSTQKKTNKLSQD